MQQNNYKLLTEYALFMESPNSEYKIETTPKTNYGRTLEYKIDQGFHGRYDGFNQGEY